MIVSKTKGIFTIETCSGARFQVTENKVSLVLKNIDELMEHWQLPLQDGLEYCIQPTGYTWKKPKWYGWKLIQVLRDTVHIEDEMSREYSSRITTAQWKHIHSRTKRILPEPADEFRLRDLIRAELEKFGVPSYRDMIAEAVQERAPQFSEDAVYKILSSHKADYRRLDAGVYVLAEWKLPFVNAVK